MAFVDAVRGACARVAERAAHVRIIEERVASYAQELPIGPPPTIDRPCGDPERIAAFWLTLNAVNFGSGWFPTLRKREGMTGYRTLEAGVRHCGPWRAAELVDIDRQYLALVFGQDPGHELMGLFERHLRALGEHLRDDWGGSFLALARSGYGSAVALAQQLARLPTWRDVSSYDDLVVPFFKRAQIAASDLHAAGIAPADDLHGLTLFADNLVPHVLRLDGVLAFDPELVARIDAEELFEHGSREEVEIRACAVHAVELLVQTHRGATAAAIDGALWHRGQEPRYKATPRHRSRSAAY